MNNFDSRLSRRTVIKLMAGSSLALYLKPFSMLSAEEVAQISQQTPTHPSGLVKISPIDRSLADVAQQVFFGDDPERAHKILWDKKGFITASGGKLPVPAERVPLVVIGGGISGLFTTYLLRDQKPVLLEQAPRFGGNAQGQSWRGIDYSIGAAYFIEPEEDTDISKVLNELGINQMWTVKEGEAPVVLDGKVYEQFWNADTAPAAKEQFTKLSEYFNKLNNEEDGFVFPDIPVVDPETQSYIDELDRISFQTKLEQIVGGKLHPHIEAAIEHYCWSSFGASMTELSAASGLNFYASEFSSVVVLPGGNSAAAERVLEKLSTELPQGNLRAGSLVFDVSVVKDGVVVSYQDAEGKVKAIHAQSVVMSCPKFVVGKILNGIEPERVAAIQKLKYRSYLVGNVLLKGGIDQSFYDMFLLGEGKEDLSNIMTSAQKQKVTDIILANFAHPNKDNTVLTLYRGMPYEGARADLYSPGVYSRYREVFEKQIHESILPLLKLKKENIVDLRITRWGHPLPVAATGLIANKTIDTLRKPFQGRVFFVEQDNWALPAFETALQEAITWAPEIRKSIQKAKA